MYAVQEKMTPFQPSETSIKEKKIKAISLYSGKQHKFWHGNHGDLLLLYEP